MAASEGVLQLDQQEEREQRRLGVLTTGEMARLSSNTLRTVRFYEEAGLISPLSRSEGGHRFFPETELHKLRFITELRTAGLSLEEIRDVLTAKQRCQSGSEAAGQLVAKLDTHVATVTERLEAMQRLLGELKKAQEVLQGCCDCRRAELFPDSCSKCEVMAAAKDQPSAISVLWGLRR